MEPADVVDMKKAFDLADSDDDGKLTPEEFKQMLNEVFSKANIEISSKTLDYYQDAFN